MIMAAQTRHTLFCFALLTLALAAFAAHPLAAQQENGRATIDFEVSDVRVPLLSRIPYVNKLFKNVGMTVGYLACDADGCKVAASCQPGAAPCQLGAKPCQLRMIACQQPCCQQAAACEEVASSQCTDETPDHFGEITKFELISSLTEAMSQVAALEAALEARAEFERQKEQLFSSLTEAMIENAKLAARVQILEQQLATQAEVAKAKVENARLQAKLGFVSEREKIVQAFSHAKAENRKLKLHVTKLEKLGAGAETAKRAKKVATQTEQEQKPAVKR